MDKSERQILCEQIQKKSPNITSTIISTTATLVCCYHFLLVDILNVVVVFILFPSLHYSSEYYFIW